jgi:hypothetical protein
MRTERPTPWGFDVFDPRLEMRRAAAEAQRTYGVVDIPGETDPAEEDAAPTDAIEREPAVAGGINRADR